MKELICILCPNGCHLSVDDSLNVTGNTCPRGEAYARKELTSPERTLTSTVRLEGCASLRRLPVRTATDIPKGKLMEAMRELNGTCVTAPVKRGDVVIANVAGTGVALVATRDAL